MAGLDRPRSAVASFSSDFSDSSYNASHASRDTVHAGDVKPHARMVRLFPRRKLGESARGKDKAVHINAAHLSQFFHFPLQEAAVRLQVCPASLKSVCRRLGIERWPYRCKRQPAIQPYMSCPRIDVVHVAHNCHGQGNGPSTVSAASALQDSASHRSLFDPSLWRGDTYASDSTDNPASDRAEMGTDLSFLVSGFTAFSNFWNTHLREFDSSAQLQVEAFVHEQS